MRSVNLLVGRNNCGKTTVLEGIFLLSGMSNPQLPFNIHRFRDLNLASDEDFGVMFRNLDFSLPIQLQGEINGHERHLKITPDYAYYSPMGDDKMPINQPVPVSTAASIRMVEGINLDFETDKKEKYHGEFHIKEGKVTIAGKYVEGLTCTYLNPRIATLVNEKFMENLLVQKRLDTLLTVLKEIVPTIEDVRMGAQNKVYVDIGAERLIPINVMGDGMRKILNYLASINGITNGVLLIDEIENGLHYSSLSTTWKALFSACRENKVQVIATTHSYECVQAFSKSYEVFEPGGDDIRLFRIEKDGENHRAVTYDAEVLRAGLEKDFEVR